MEQFDVNVGTLLIILILGHISTGILIVTYAGGINKSRAINVFLLAKLFQSTAWAMYLGRAFMHSMVLKVCSNAILFIGVVFELVAFMILKGSFSETKKRVLIGLLAVCSVIFISVVAFNTSESIKIAVISLVGAVLISLPVYVLYTDRSSSLLQKLITVVYSSTVLFLLGRSYYAMKFDIELRLSSTEFFNVGLFLMLYLVMFAGGIGFILLDKEKMDQ